MLFVICILCAALALWLAATLFLGHRELLEIQKALEDIGAGNLNRRIVTRGPQAIRSIGYGINKIVQQNQQSAIQQKRHEQAYKQLITNLSHDIKTPLASLTGYLEAACLFQQLNSTVVCFNQRVISKKDVHNGLLC